MPILAKKHDVSFPLDAEQAANIDEMFIDLYRQLKVSILGDMPDFADLEPGVLIITQDGISSNPTEVISLEPGVAGTFLRSTGLEAEWSELVLPNDAAQGDILYGSAADTLAVLVKDTNATRYLSNTGASNNPAWAQVNLANGVTGTLPVGSGGTGTATTFTEGSVVFAGASGVYTQDNSNFFWDDTNNRLGIGTSAPLSKLEIRDTGGNNVIFLSGYSADVSGLYLNIMKSRGALGVHTIVQNNDELGAVAYRGSDGTGFVQAARVSAFCDGTPGANDMPGRLVFYTTADGSAAPTERVTIKADGNVGIGTTAPTTYRLHVVTAGNSNQNVLGLYDSDSLLVDIFTSGSDTTMRFINGAGTTKVNFSTNGDTYFTGGNVGIGTTTPKSQLHIEGASGWVVADEQDTDPTATQLDANDSIAIYNKSNKFVIAYNNAGTITYVTIPLDGSTTTWTHGTTAP